MQAKPERLIYAFGDVHGCYDLLLKGADAMMEHLDGRQGKAVMLGDYVDRGPQSRQVVEWLMDTPATCLKGNHEKLMIEAVRGTGSMYHWLDNGGDATIASYGALEDIPEAHIAWMEGLPSMAQDDHRVYVHAGIMPGPSLALSEQDEETCLWIRERFLRAPARDFPEGVHVVHGHTPVWACKPDPAKPELLPHRTNLDTAAFHTGVLTIGVFDPDAPGGPIEILQVRKD